MRAVAQIRLISAATVLAIATSVFNSYANPRLSGYLAGTGMRSIKSAASLVTFSESDQEKIRHILAHTTIYKWLCCASLMVDVGSGLSIEYYG